MASPLLQTIRGLAAQKGLYDKIFRQGASGYSLSASAIADIHGIFNLAGIKLNEGEEIGLDGAQMLLAGGAFVNDIEVGLSIGQCVGDASNAIAGLTSILSGLGLIDHQVSDFTSLLANGALAIASGGANVLADIGAVIALIGVVSDLGQDFSGNPIAAKQAALKALSNSVKGFVNKQINYATSQANLYNAGQLDVFDFIANVALNAPLEFPGFFPDLAGYFPSWISVSFRAQGNSDGIFSSSHDDERATIRELFITRQAIQDVLLQKFLIDPMRAYNQELTVDRVITIRALSFLSLLTATSVKGPVELSFNYDIVSACQMLGVTPSILGDDWLFKGFMRNETDLSRWQDTLPYPPITLPFVKKPKDPGVMINSVPQWTDSEKLQLKESQELKEFQLYLQHLDEIGDIDTLLSIPEGKAMITAWGNIVYTPGYSDLDGTVTNMALNRGSIDVSKKSWFISDRKKGLDVTKNPLFWPYIKANYSIDVSDYWKCLNTLKVMQNSQILSDRTRQLTQFGSIDDIMNGFQRVYQYVLAKNINRLARLNVSKYLGIPYDKLGSRIQSGGEIVFYQKGKT